MGSYFSEDIQWSTMDYVIAAILLCGASFVVAGILSVNLSKKNKRILLLLFIVFFLLLWVEMAVGVFGSPIAGS